MEFTDNKSWQVYSSILSEEGIKFSYSTKAATAYFDLENREVVVPVWEWMDEPSKQLLVSHEVGHAKHSNYSREAYEEYVSKFHSLFNVVEDARIERLMKREYLGLNKIFSYGYSVLMKNGIFEIPDNLDKLNITERLNLYAKLGTLIEVPFHNEKEYEFSYRLMNLNTKAEVVSLCYDILEYLKENKQEENSQNKSDGNCSYSKGNKSDKEMPSMDKSEKSEDSSNSEMENQSANENNKSENSSDNEENSKRETSGSGNDGADDNDVLDQLNDSLSEKMNENIAERDKASKKDKENSHYNDLVEIITTDYSKDFFNFSKKMYPLVKPTLKNKFYRDIEKMIVNIAKAANNVFKQKMSANENKMTRNRNVGKLDMKKLAKYAISDSIFRNVKMLPEGKNHAIVIMVDYSSSMTNAHQLMGEFIQACVFGQFCKMNNIPFSIYAYGVGIVTYDFAETTNYRIIRDGIMLIGDNFNFDIPCIMWLANNRHYGSTFKNGASEFKFRQAGTPTLEALTFATRKLKLYKQNGIEKTYLYIMTDGAYNGTINCKRAVSGSYVDNNSAYIQNTENVIIDNKQYNIKQYESYFKNAGYNNEDWAFEFFLANIKKETNSTIVYSYIDSFNSIKRSIPNGVSYVHKNIDIKDSYLKKLMFGNFYFFKHFYYFETGNVNYGEEGTFSYNFKNNPFIDQYLFINTDELNRLDIDRKYSTSKNTIEDDNFEDYLKNNNKINKLFEVLVRSFINIFA